MVCYSTVQWTEGIEKQDLPLSLAKFLRVLRQHGKSAGEVLSSASLGSPPPHTSRSNIVMPRGATTGAPARVMLCDDQPGWSNGHNKTCADYAMWCADGAFKSGAEWLGGAAFNNPEISCCACGRATHHAPPPPPPPSDGITAHGYELHLKASCRGADREVKKPRCEV